MYSLSVESRGSKGKPDDSSGFIRHFRKLLSYILYIRHRIPIFVSQVYAILYELIGLVIDYDQSSIGKIRRIFDRNLI